MKQLWFDNVVIPDEGILQLQLMGRLRDLRRSCVIDVQRWKCKDSDCCRRIKGKPAVVYGYDNKQVVLIDAENLASATKSDVNYWEGFLSLVIKKYTNNPVKLYDRIIEELSWFREVMSDAEDNSC